MSNWKPPQTTFPSPDSLEGARIIQFIRQVAGEPIRFDQALLVWNSMDGSRKTETVSTFKTFNFINHKENHWTTQNPYQPKGQAQCQQS
jgi:hypothetical protein